MSVLPTTEFNGHKWFVDERLHQFRQVDNPHRFIDFQTFDEGTFNESTGVWLRPDDLNDREFQCFAFDKAYLVEQGVRGAETLDERGMQDVADQFKEWLREMEAGEALESIVKEYVTIRDWKMRAARRGCGCLSAFAQGCLILQHRAVPGQVCDCLCHVEGLAENTCGFCGHPHYAGGEDCTFVDPDGVACTCTGGQYRLLEAKDLELQMCGNCGRSVRPGSGWFVNRVVEANDIPTRVELPRPFPAGGFICFAGESDWDEEAWRERKSEIGCACTTSEPDDCKVEVPMGQRMCWCKCHHPGDDDTPVGNLPESPATDGSIAIYPPEGGQA